MNITLHENEKVLLELKPSQKSALYWMISRVWHVMFLLIIIGLALLVNFFISPNSPDSSGTKRVIAQLGQLSPTFFITGLLVVIAALVALYFWFKLTIKAYDYTITNQRCILRYGLLSLNTRMIPYSQINDIDIRTTVLERPFGLASVYLDCFATVMSTSRRAGNNTTRLEGLTYEQAESVAHLVSGYIVKK